MREIVREVTREELIKINNKLESANDMLKAELNEAKLVAKASRDLLMNALNEIRTICESRERCDNDCIFADPIDTSHKLYGCKIMGFVDDFGECHANEAAREFYEVSE